MGFLDPVQTPFNYHRQMAMLVIGGNRIRVPGDSGSTGGGSSPAGQSQSTRSQLLLRPPAPRPRGWPGEQSRRQGVEEGPSRAWHTCCGVLWGQRLLRLQRLQPHTGPLYAPVCLAAMVGEYCYPENGVPAGRQRTRAQDESLVPKATDLDQEGGVLVPGMGLE